MATLNCENWMNTTTTQYSYIYNSWAACKFVNNTGAPIKVMAVEIWCKGGTTNTYAFANTINSTAPTSGVIISDTSQPSTSLEWKTYTLTTPMEVVADATFYAGIRGTSSSTYIYVQGYKAASDSTANAYYCGIANGGTLNSLPDMGADSGTPRTLGIRVIYELNGVIYIDNGTSFDAYQIFVDNGTDWEQYIPYIDNGTSWDICS